MEFDEYGYEYEGTDENYGPRANAEMFALPQYLELLLWCRWSRQINHVRGPWSGLETLTLGCVGSLDLTAHTMKKNNYMYNGPGGSRSGGRYAEPPLGPRYLDQGGFFWGRGYGPAGPPNQQQNLNGTVSFLLRCGVPHYNLSGLPNILLRLMEPESCGICAQEFNCFSAAQLHYNSRLHVRNVKKWLIQQAQAGPQRPKEIPLRARELYCELCDVQITSKIHADSHYAGRSHRSIVEGNKPPKNPFLLQKNMEERVVKLIRREKKLLKPVEKTKEKPKTESKSIPPELFCEICSTSVTCSEQMTMHLNGKKHLAKEKQHIFKMMKGETTTPNPAGTTDTAKDVDAQNSEAQGTVATGAESQEKGETDVQENDFDWGQGSGPWDDDHHQ